eukprot:GHVU01111158.1.p1 GENE.GHVU01111158.1~~GHVU01111158.1.p1  ORF type:complete len:649 (-),score=85.54 GHVU01111158.1:443-2389(-)
MEELMRPAITRAAVSKLASTACLVGLHYEALLLRRADAFGLATDCSHVDDINLTVALVRCRLAIHTLEYEFDLAVLPMHDGTGGDDLYDIVEPLLDGLDTTWREKAMGCSTDGENKMTGIHEGFTTYVENSIRAAGNRDTFYRIWDPCHQLDNGLERGIKGMDVTATAAPITGRGVAPPSQPSAVKYMANLQKLNTDVRANSARINKRRTAAQRLGPRSMATARFWTVNKIARYYDARQEDVATLQAGLFGLPAPFDPSFWIVNSAVAALTTVWNHALEMMQLQDLTFERQDELCLKLDSDLSAMLPSLQEVAGVAVTREDELRTYGEGMYKHTKLGPLTVYHLSAVSNICDYSATASTAWRSDGADVAVAPHLEGAGQDPALTAIVRFHITLVHTARLTRLSRPEKQLTGSSAAPPATPAGFAKISGSVVTDLVNSQAGKLRRMYPRTPLPQLRQQMLEEHRGLVRHLAGRSDEDTRAARWEELTGVTYLHQLAMLFRVVLPGSMRVEAGFSLAKAVAENRGNMGVEGVQGVLQCGQLLQLREAVAESERFADSTNRENSSATPDAVPSASTNTLSLLADGGRRQATAAAPSHVPVGNGRRGEPSGSGSRRRRAVEEASGSRAKTARKGGAETSGNRRRRSQQRRDH